MRSFFILTLIGALTLQAVHADAFGFSSYAAQTKRFHRSTTKRTTSPSSKLLSLISRHPQERTFHHSKSNLSSSTSYNNPSSSSAMGTSSERNNTRSLQQFLHMNRNQKPSSNTLTIKSRFLKTFTTPTIPSLIITTFALMYNLISNPSVRQSINTFFVKFPYAAAFIICALKATIADLVVQKSTSPSSDSSSTIEKSSFEYKRNIAFFFYGGLYQGCVQEHIFNHIFPAVFGNGVDFVTVASKVLFDIFFISPFICLPVAYVIKGGIYKNSIRSSIKRYMHDVRVNHLLRKNWMVWGPAQSVTFSIIPEQYRISFIAFISFFWLLILSSISGKKVKVE